MTTTREARSTSSSVKNPPGDTSQARMTANAAPTPSTRVCQLPAGPITWARVLTPGDTARTPSRAAIAAASAGVRVVTAPWPIRTPPTLAEPADTVSTSVPRLDTRCSIDALAPSPSAIMTITAATPMITPSDVSAERSLFLVIASNARAIVLVNLMALLSPPRAAAITGPARHLRHQRRSTGGRRCCRGCLRTRHTGDDRCALSQPIGGDRDLRAIGNADADRNPVQATVHQLPNRCCATPACRLVRHGRCGVRSRELLPYLVGRREPQRRRRHSQRVVRAIDLNRHRRRHAGLQQLRVIRHVDHGRIRHDVLDRLRLQLHQPHRAGEFTTRVGIDGEVHRRTWLHATNI